MALLDEKNFIKTFNDQWCWRVVKLVHLGEDGSVRDFPGVFAGIEAGRAGEGNFTNVTKESQVPWGSYIYLQSVIRTRDGKPAYTRLFIDITDDMAFQILPKRAAILTGREVVTFYPVDKEEEKKFLQQEKAVEVVRKLCDIVGKDPAEVEFLN